MPEDRVIDAIYEAGVVPDRWPQLLEDIAATVGAKGGLLVASNHGGVQWLMSPAVEPVYIRWLAEGWQAQDDRLARARAMCHPGFVTGEDIHSAEERARLPLYTDFLVPLSFDAPAATTISGLGDDALQISIEEFPCHAAARAAVPALDLLRPHLARASMLAARLGLERARVAVTTLAQIGVPAAVLGRGRHLIAANALFEARLGDHCHDTPAGLRLTDGTADHKLGDSLDRLKTAKSQCRGASLPLRVAAEELRIVLHLVPLCGSARDLFTGATAILLLAIPGSRSAPGVDLIQGLLDLTPAEARLARGLATGLTLAEAAHSGGILPTTARTHLKRVFAKTGLSRQADLVSLLASVAPPVSP